MKINEKILKNNKKTLKNSKKINFYVIFMAILLFFLIFGTFFDLQISTLLSDLKPFEYHTNNNLAVFLENYGEFILYFFSFFSFIFIIFYLFFQKKLKKSDFFRNFFIFSIIIFLICVFSAIITNFIKEFLSDRMRFRAMNYINDFSNYSAWYDLTNKAIKNGFMQDAFRSFPSGHTVAVSTLFTFFLLPNLFKIKSKFLKIICYIVPILLVVLVAFSRIVAGAHFLTDVVFSMIIVLGLVILSDYFILQKMLDKSNQMEYN